MIHLVLPTESVFFWATVFASLSIARKLRALQSGVSCLCFFSFCRESFVLHTLVHFFDNVFNGNQSIQESICVIHGYPFLVMDMLLSIHSRNLVAKDIYVPLCYSLVLQKSIQNRLQNVECLTYIFIIYITQHIINIYIFQTEFVQKTPLESN